MMPVIFTTNVQWLNDFFDNLPNQSNNLPRTSAVKRAGTRNSILFGIAETTVSESRYEVIELPKSY